MTLTPDDIAGSWNPPPKNNNIGNKGNKGSGNKGNSGGGPSTSGGYSGYSYSSGGGYGGGGGGGGSSTTVSETSQESTRAEARAIAIAAFQEVLGRNPNQRLSRRFRQALNKYERKHPLVTTTTTSGDSSVTKTKGGVSAEARNQFVDDWMNDNKKVRREQGAFNVATEYMDVFMKAIGG